MNQEKLERLAQEFEAQQQVNKPEPQEENAPVVAEALPVEIMEQNKAIAERTEVTASASFGTVVGSVKQDILDEAKKKITDEKVIDKHAENLKNIADKALGVEAETASLVVEEQEADNKVRKQEIRNKLIVLKAEAKRLKKEQEQLNREQKAEHKARNKQAKWDLYGDKLTKMKYSYVPNIVVLSMLLFFDGVRSFFDGLGTVSTAIVKAFKWVLLVGAILIVLLAIPVTREWLTNLLSGGK